MFRDKDEEAVEEDEKAVERVKYCRPEGTLEGEQKEPELVKDKNFDWLDWMELKGLEIQLQFKEHT